jgi:hypothetical protein
LEEEKGEDETELEADHKSGRWKEVLRWMIRDNEFRSMIPRRSLVMAGKI